MSAQTSLRLVDPSQDDDLASERRQSCRYVITGRVTAVRGDAQSQDAARRICSLELMNISDNGVGALCQEPVDIGARITIFFPPHGPERGFDLTGHVSRCRPGERGHEVGVRFDNRQAA